MKGAPCLVGVVVIGRNEGQRLMQCLRSVLVEGVPLVYVDSGSSDGSVAGARALGVASFELDRCAPFSAARARNEGFDRLLGEWPSLAYVQFIDGDCTLAPGWLDRAAAHLGSDARQGAVVGCLQEREPARSVYNMLCALEWRSPAGPIIDAGRFGGISMIRASVFRRLGGFNPELIAGEEPEFAARMGRAGYAATKLDIPMATHDAGMTRFSQWWTRAVRSGHAIGHRADLDRAGAVRGSARAKRSVLCWAVALPAASLLGLARVGPPALLVPLAGYGVLGWRIWRHRRRRGDPGREAAVYAAFTVLGKFAEAIGLARHAWNKSRRQFEIIEYK